MHACLATVAHVPLSSPSSQGLPRDLTVPGTCGGSRLSSASCTVQGPESIASLVRNLGTPRTSRGHCPWCTPPLPGLSVRTFWSVHSLTCCCVFPLGPAGARGQGQALPRSTEAQIPAPAWWQVGSVLPCAPPPPHGVLSHPFCVPGSGLCGGAGAPILEHGSCLYRHLGYTRTLWFETNPGRHKGSVCRGEWPAGFQPQLPVTGSAQRGLVAILLWLRGVGGCFPVLQTSQLLRFLQGSGHLA